MYISPYACALRLVLIAINMRSPEVERSEAERRTNQTRTHPGRTSKKKNRSQGRRRFTRKTKKRWWLLARCSTRLIFPLTYRSAVPAFSQCRENQLRNSVIREGGQGARSACAYCRLIARHEAPPPMVASASPPPKKKKNSLDRRTIYRSTTPPNQKRSDAKF